MDLGVMAIKGAQHIRQSFSITGTSLSDGLVSYLRQLLGESYPSVEMQLVHSAAPDDLAMIFFYGFRYGQGPILSKWSQTVWYAYKMIFFICIIPKRKRRKTPNNSWLGFVAYQP